MHARQVLIPLTFILSPFLNKFSAAKCTAFIECIAAYSNASALPFPHCYTLIHHQQLPVLQAPVVATVCTGIQFVKPLYLILTVR